MSGNISKDEQLRELVFDTTYLLPAFGVDVDVDTSKNIKLILNELADVRGVKLIISDLSPLEGFLKSFRLAEKMKNEEGEKAAKMGFLAVTKDSTFSIVSHSDERTFNGACEIRQNHRDPFDCFIFATARSINAPLVTEDIDAQKFLGKKKVLSWRNLKQYLSKL